MKIISRLRNYINTPTKCFIPRCKARCCVDAPLPEDFLPKHPDKIQRNIYSGINIGQNWVEDTYNSVIYNTTPNPIQLVGFDQNGNKVMAVSKEMLEKLQIKSMEQLTELIGKYKEFPNYCPFITNHGRCNVYKDRPPICREFGTNIKNPLNICKDKSSRKDIAKFWLEAIKESFTGIFSSYKSKN